ncbi:MAG: hypothetical protein AVDCRST_MAG85-390 [uncultured Solirubrobacteraceae bacterium]|uniref:Uncharacterized protein n=1 Tax=uncultured Solirubrobacteraceae bacterium TaxID=1162706 RepID=A0A6J4RQS0_9ACTN|nr:MAG: hypothetical protein AVDCRST_MAG85-390 [uncultured Solirubrobacteraceae bacterium]
MLVGPHGGTLRPLRRVEPAARGQDRVEARALDLADRLRPTAPAEDLEAIAVEQIRGTSRLADGRTVRTAIRGARECRARSAHAEHRAEDRQPLPASRAEEEPPESDLLLDERLRLHGERLTRVPHDLEPRLIGPHAGSVRPPSSLRRRCSPRSTSSASSSRRSGSCSR